MNKVTICIPARNELYLNETVADIFKKASGDIEIILVLDDCWNQPLPPDDERLTIVHWGGRRGMRAGINAGAELGKGKYLLKCDAHVSFSEGFDEELQKNCDDNWLVTPLRYSLDVETWGPKLEKKHPPVDYEYLSYPYEDGKEVGLHAKYWWDERHKTRKSFNIDENMTLQGSCWFMPMNYFKKLIYPMDEENYGMFIGEPQEIGLKVWLSGGKQMINKIVSYSHLWKGQGYRDLHMQKMGFAYTRVGRHELDKGNAFSTDFWFNNKPFDGRIHDLEWLVERFWPVPSWPDERSLWTHKPTS
jgi:glycosyltransferase involved in cell wall biosynthesis